VQANKPTTLVIAILALFVGSSSKAAPPKRIVLKKPDFSRRIEKEYCGRLFQKEWTSAVAEITEAVEVNGFKVGIGSKIDVLVDGNRRGKGTFLGRVVDSEFRTSSYMFKDYGDKKNYLIDASRCEIEMKGVKLAANELQSMSTTLMQQGETCAVSAVMNYFTQLLEAGLEGNGLLRRELQSPEGYLTMQEHAFDYYLRNRNAGNFKPIFEHFAEKYGYVCQSLDAVRPEIFLSKVTGLLKKGIPALLEFWIGPEMITSDFQWVDSAKEVLKVDKKTGQATSEIKVAGDDLRFWAPRKTGERNGGGHALVSFGMFTSESKRDKILVKDSDWMKRPVEWDYKKYLESRAKSSGMISWHCRNAPIGR